MVKITMLRVASGFGNAVAELLNRGHLLQQMEWQLSAVIRNPPREVAYT